MKKFLNTWKKDIFVGLGIFITAILLRTYNLNALPIFGDEAIYIRWAQIMRAEPTLRFLPLSDGKQPLFMWVVIPFQKLFSDPLIAGRMVSAISGVGTLIGVFVLSNLLFSSNRVSLSASFIYAISPYSVFFDRLALVDSMLTFFGVWTLIFLVITVKKVRLDSAMLAGFALGGAMLTKSPGIFFAILTPTTTILHKWPKKFKDKFNKASIFVFLFTFTYLIGVGLYNILRLGPNFHMIGIRNQDYVYPLLHLLTSPLDPLTSFLIRIFEYFWLMGPGALVFLILFGVYLGFREKRKETLILLFWGLLPILAIAEYSRTMTARYIYFAMPYIFILSAVSFLSTHKLTFKYLKILLIIFAFQALFIDRQLLTNPQEANLPRSERSGYLEEWTAGTGIKEVSELIREEYLRNPRTKIVVGTEGYFGTLPDALQAYLADLPEVTVIGVGQPIRDTPVQLIESKKFGNKTYLVVNNDRFPGNEDELGLKLLAVYTKALRPDKSQQQLLFFEVTETALDY